jgi:predicted nucleic acid-binding protein
MTGKVFVDSKVLISAHDRDAGAKQQRAAERLKQLWDNGQGRLSTQVLPEFDVNSTQKIKKPLARSWARKIIRNYGLWVESATTPSTLVRASEIGETWKVSFWDGMILAAAEQDGARQLLLIAAKLSDKDPLTPAPLPQGGEGRGNLSYRPRPLGGEGGAQRRVRGFIRHSIVQSSIMEVLPPNEAKLEETRTGDH